MDRLNKLLIENEKLKSSRYQEIQRAEVLTPRVLRQDLLDTIPKSFWRNPDVRILEPSVGKGGFILDIIERLMKGLSKYIKDDVSRYNHIVTNCIFYGDISKSNVKYVKEVIGCPNGYLGDSLKNKSWRNFDLVIGNPPFQTPNPKELKSRGANNSLWQSFIFKSFERWLKQDGYLCFITPAGWRAPESKLWSLIRTKHIMYVSINSQKVGKELFNKDITFDFYCIRNSTFKHGISKTIIKDIEGKLSSHNYLGILPFLANGAYEEINNRLSLDAVYDVRIGAHYDIGKLKDNKDNVYKYPVMSYFRKDGPIIKYDVDPGFLHNLKKVLINTYVLYSMYDDGVYGYTSNIFGIIVKNKKEGLSVDNFFKSPIGSRIRDMLQWSFVGVGWRAYKYLNVGYI